MGPKEEWAGEFGNAYTARNQVDWVARTHFWKRILDRAPARSIFEVGCNAGWNLSAIKRVAPWANPCGIDINYTALRRARHAGLDVQGGDIHSLFTNGDVKESKELVFTAGVLIHLPQPELDATMRAIVDLSCRWVLAIEYWSEAHEEVNYRGMDGMLWKRPFGKMYQALGLTMLASGGAPKKEGFDDCTWWLLEKP